MHSRAWRLRMAALLAGGSFAVHQLRFLVAYGSHSSSTLAHQGHAYLTLLAPLVIGALMLAAAEFVGALARARAPGAVPSLARLWVASSAALISVYCVQELTEGFLSSGHAEGLAGVFGGGGWLSVPIAFAIGLLIALLMRGAAVVLRLMAARRRLRRLLAVTRRTHPLIAAGGAVFLCLAGPRAPPSFSL